MELSLHEIGGCVIAAVAGHTFVLKPLHFYLLEWLSLLLALMSIWLALWYFDWSSNYDALL